MRRRALAAQSGITLLVAGRVGPGKLGTDEAVTHMTLGYVSYDVYTRKFTENGTSRAPRRQRGPRPPPTNPSRNVKTPAKTK